MGLPVQDCAVYAWCIVLISIIFHIFPSRLLIQKSNLYIVTSSRAKIVDKSLRMMTSLHSSCLFECVISQGSSFLQLVMTMVITEMYLTIYVEYQKFKYHGYVAVWQSSGIRNTFIISKNIEVSHRKHHRRHSYL